MKNTISAIIIEYLKPVAEGLQASEVRIGLGYTSVRLSNGRVGLAWTAESVSGSCTHQPKAGTLGGSSALELLEMLSAEKNPLFRSVGLATANALTAGLPHPESRQEDVLDLVNVKAEDKVVMVGYFGPLIPLLRMTGCRLDILELRSDKPGTLTPQEGKEALSSCSVAIITSTSIITGTLDELLAGLGKPRAVITLGPSSIMLPPVFQDSPVTHIAGAWVRNPAAVEKIVSEGGGTMLLKKYMDFETICL
jgi:uncharacterized protein (DUF4213/DUF364 family)